MDVQSALQQNALPKAAKQSQPLNIHEATQIVHGGSSKSKLEEPPPEARAPKPDLKDKTKQMEAVQPKKPEDSERDYGGQAPTVAPGMENRSLDPEVGEAEETVKASRMKAFVESSAFEVISSILVVTCMVLMAFAIEFNGRQTGHILGFQQYPISISESMPNTVKHMEILDMIFNVLFTIELVFRLLAFKMSSFRSGWILMDLVLVTSSWLFDTGAVDIAWDHTTAFPSFALTAPAESLEELQDS